MNHFAVLQDAVGRERLVVTRIVGYRTPGQLRTRELRQPPRTRRVIAMRVRAEDPAQTIAAQMGQLLDVFGQIRPRIDDRELGRADEVRVGARPGHHAGIGRGEPAQSRREFRDDAGDYGFQAPPSPGFPAAS